MSDMSPIAVLGENFEWAEIRTDEAARLVAEGVIYFCPADSDEHVACHNEAVYHVSPRLSDAEQAALIASLRSA